MCAPVCGGWRFLLRAGGLYPPLPVRAFTGARLAPARFADSLPTAHGIPWKESLGLESKRRWGSHSRSHQEEPTTRFHSGGDRKRPPPRVWTRDAGSQQDGGGEKFGVCRGRAARSGRRTGQRRWVVSAAFLGFPVHVFQKKKIPMLNKTRF